MPSFQAVKGMRDLLPREAETLNSIIAKARETANLYGYREVVTPVVESYELLSAKSGEEIRSRMFTFKDLGNRTVALRPEFTASIARLATGPFKNDPKPLRIMAIGSVYRYDEPQRGRYREFYQSDYEIMGASSPEADAEIILLTDTLMKSVGLRNHAFKLGHVGIIRGILSQENIDEKTQNAILQLMDKKEYEQALKLINSENCKTILESLLRKTTSEVFEAIKITKKIVEDYPNAVSAAENLQDILTMVTKCGCTVAIVEPTFARGLEYYTGMIFEVYIPELDIALGGGGRYNRLVEVFGGEQTPAIGVAHGLDRIAIAIQTQKTIIEERKRTRVTVVPVKAIMKNEAMSIARIIRNSGITAELEVMGRKMNKALEDADRRQMDFAIIVGERELGQGSVVVRNLKKREQTIVAVTDLIKTINSYQ